ncbi:hypothetical protein BTS2_2234 [Bacillus sp. TS-2]|nr:hypothetical protein BTS2_2234 [Bacillus sp. TS-2]
MNNMSESHEDWNENDENYQYDLEKLNKPKDLPPRSQKHKKKRGERKKSKALNLIIVRILLLLFLIVVIGAFLVPSWLL